MSKSLQQLRSIQSKNTLRETFKKTRNALSQKRRAEAQFRLTSFLIPRFKFFKSILSFASFNSEIDTTLLNAYLAWTGQLLLPRIEEEQLKIYHVTHPKTQLQRTAFGLYQPNPQLCSLAEPQAIQLALVPALGFDQNKHRLGYGRGFYDRFLLTVPWTQTFGLGFKEQWIKRLPPDLFDIALQKVFLF